jgi:DNA-binding transcriptional LysR family regulator
LDRLDAMSVLLSAVENGSLSKASRKLGLPLATVSRKVAELEKHLNASLLIRSAKGLELTPAGRSYVTAARAILEELTQAERAAAGEYTKPKGDLAVTAPTMFGRLHVLPVVTRFLSAFPEVAVGLVLTDRIAHFVDDQIDVALRIGALPDSSLIAVRLGATRRMVCASPAYLAAHGTPRTPDDLAGHDCITYAGFMSPDVWTFFKDKTAVAVPVHARLVVGSAEAACDAACAGIGITSAFAYHFQTALEREALTTLLDEFQPAPLPVNLVYTANRFLPIKVRAFLDLAAPRLKKVFADFQDHAS